jgi:hypothetical protein
MSSLYFADSKVAVEDVVLRTLLHHLKAEIILFDFVRLWVIINDVR